MSAGKNPCIHYFTLFIKKVPTPALTKVWETRMFIE